MKCPFYIGKECTYDVGMLCDYCDGKNLCAGFTFDEIRIETSKLKIKV